MKSDCCLPLLKNRIEMMYKFTIIKTRGYNSDKAEVGMNVEVSSKLLSSFFHLSINPLNIRDNRDYDVIRKAFMDKYGVDLKHEEMLNTSIDKYIRCKEI